MHMRRVKIADLYTADARVLAHGFMLWTFDLLSCSSGATATRQRYSCDRW
jgi:hypothetical protein